MSTPSYRASRRKLLQAAATGIVLSPLVGARGVAAAPAALPPSGSIIDAHIHPMNRST